MTRGGGGVWEMLTIADEGGRGGLKTLKLADVICGQPLIGFSVDCVLEWSPWSQCQRSCDLASQSCDIPLKNRYTNIEILVYVLQSSAVEKQNTAKYFHFHNKFSFLRVTVRKIQHLILIQNIKRTVLP